MLNDFVTDFSGKRDRFRSDIEKRTWLAEIANTSNLINPSKSARIKRRLSAADYGAGCVLSGPGRTLEAMMSHPLAEPQPKRASRPKRISPISKRTSRLARASSINSSISSIGTRVALSQRPWARDTSRPTKD